MKELSRAIALLFAIEGDDFVIDKLDPPFIFTKKYGVFSMATGMTVKNENGKGAHIELVPCEVKNTTVKVDWYVVIFPDVVRKDDASGNTLLLKNDSHFKTRYEKREDFTPLVRKKFWIQIDKSDR